MKKTLYSFWPILFIFGLWLIFSSPYFLHQKVPFSSTYQVTFFPPWNTYPRIGIPVKNGAMPDVIGQIYPWRYLVMSLWKSGQIPLWNMYSFAGTPLLANYQSAVLSPFNILFILFPFVDGWSILILLQPLLAGTLMYVFVKSLKVSKVGSLLSSMSFMFCGFIVVWMGYGTLGYALLFLPLGMYSIGKYFQCPKIRYAVLLSFVLPLSFFSGHFQISLYFLIALVAFTLYKSLVTHSIKKAYIVFLFLFFGILLCLPQLIPSLEFYTQSLRSGLYQRGEVIPWGYLPTLLSPDFFGNPVTRNDWFGHYAEWNEFIGTIGFLLALYSLRSWKKGIIIFFFCAGILSLLLAMPSPLGDAIVTFHIPVLATSAASRVISLYCFFFAVLVGFGWDSLNLSLEKKELKEVGQWIIVGLIFFVILWAIIFGKFFLPLDKVSIAKQNLVLPTILWIVLSFGVIVSLFLQKKIAFVCFSIVVLILTGFDMYRFASKWQSFDPKSYVFENLPVTKEFQQISGYQRAIGNYGAEVSNYYQLPSLEGYDALYPKRYGEFISYVNTGSIGESSRSVVSIVRDGKYVPQVINLLNVSYVIHKKSDDNMPWTFPYWTYPNGQFMQIFDDSAYRILKNTKVFPRAFLVGSYDVQQIDRDILSTMFGKDFNLRHSVVIEQKPTLPISNDPNATSAISKYTSNEITIKTSTKSNMLLFLSDTDYPGWKAYIDNKQTSILRADYAFRTIVVPKGNHIVTFKYQPTSFLYGVIGSIVGLLGIVVGSIAYKNRKISL